MKILFVPDIHIGNSLNYGKVINGQNSKITDKKELLDFTYDVVEDNEVDLVILTGDIWETTNLRPNYISMFFDFLDKCSKMCPIHIIQGNHDFTRSGDNVISTLDFLEYMENVHTFKNITTKTFDNVSITYLPFYDRSQLNKESLNDSIEYISSKLKSSIVEGNTNICVGHMAIQSSLYVGDEIDDISKEIFLPLDCLSEFSYSLLGHVHKFQVFSTIPYIAHVGSLDRSCFGEGSKFLCLLDTDKEEVETIELPSKELVEIEITIPENTDPTEYVSNYLKTQSLSNSIVRIKIETDNASATLDKDKINKELMAQGAVHIVGLIEKKKLETLDFSLDIDETIEPEKAVDIFVKPLNLDEAFKEKLSIACKNIIKSVKGKS